MNPNLDLWNDSPAEVRQTVERLRAVVPHLVNRLRPGTPLDSCGFDSLEVVELLCAIETACGVRLAIDEADGRTTGAELLARIAARAPTPVAAR
jgi:acyl carrier protein